MTNWIDVYPDVIKAAIKAGGGTIVVDSEPKVGLGKMALERMCPEMIEHIYFVIEPGDPLPYLRAEPLRAPAGHQSKDPCVTRTPGTGADCECEFDCDNYWIRAGKR